MNRRARPDRRPLLRPTVLIAFARARVEKFETHNGVRCALVKFRSQPDLVISRDAELTAEKTAELLQRYVLCPNGIPETIEEAGATFFLVPDSGAELAAELAS